jgi:O-antigen/teichoic acid export membrane protein
MSIKKNTLANFVSQIYVTLISIVMVPLYIKYMGAEAYGLVGFFAMLQVWFNLLDMGLTPTVARESARFRGGVTDAMSYIRLVSALERVFLVVALIGGIAMFASSDYIAHDWLKASVLPIAEVKAAIELMALIIAMRWMGGLYRGVISGSERLVWLGGYNAIIVTFRFVAVLPVLIVIGVTPTIFFGFQLGVAVIELAGLVYFANRLLPDIPQGLRLPWDWTALQPVLKFSLSIAFTNSLWVFVTQTDKLVLSQLLSLQDYGYFILAVLVANGVGLISGPISTALQPRMVKLYAEGDEDGVVHIYRNATQLVCVIVIPATLVLAFFAEQVLWAWTGNAEIARKAAPVLLLYALGNGLLSIGSLAYCLQFAKGDLRLHLIETPLFLFIFLPGLLWSVGKYGINGAGYSWLVTMALFFVFWLPIIHQRFFKGHHISWIINDVGRVLGISLCAVSLGYIVIVTTSTDRFGERLPLALMIMLLGAITVTLSAMGSRLGREIICRRWRIHISKYFN